MQRRTAVQRSEEAADAYSIRRYRDADAAGLLRLLQETFEGWPHVETSAEPIDHLRWKLQSSADAHRYHVIAEINGAVVGALLFLIQRVKLGDRMLLARQGVDGAVSPAHQNKGIMSAMRRFAREEFADVFDLYLGGATKHPAMASLGMRDGGDHFANAIEAWSRPLRWEALTSDFKLGSGRSALRRARGAASLGGWLIGRVAQRRVQLAGPAISERACFDDRIDAFWEVASRPFDFMVVRNKDYLNWRHADARGGEFIITLAEQGSQVLGYAVLRVSHQKGYLADLLVLPERLDVARALVQAALGRFRQAGIPSVRCYMASYHPYTGILGETGFVRTKRGVGVKYRGLRPGADVGILQRPGATLHATLGDWDLI